MKRKIKIFLPVLAIIFTAQSCLILGGSRRPAGPEIELLWWKPFDEPVLLQPLVTEFQKVRPNVKITYVQKNVETYEADVLNALAAGEGPDIFTIHNDWLPRYLDKVVAAPEEIWKLRDFQQNFLEVVNFDLVSKGKIFAVPLAVDVLSLYYNKDMLSGSGIPRPPATWEELISLTSKLTLQDRLGNFQRSVVALGTAENINRAPDILSLLLLQNGTGFYHPEKSQGGSFDESRRDETGKTYSPAATALEFYTQFANPAKVTYTWNSRSNNSIEGFANSQVAMIFSYAYLRKTLREKAPFLNYSVAPAPQIDLAQNRINFANYWAETVSKQSQNQKAAWEFLKFISSKEVLPKYYEAQKQVSSRIDILETQLSDPEIGSFAEHALSAKSFYKPDADAVESIFVQMINDVVLRDVSAEEAVGAASRKLNLLWRNF